MNTIIIEFKDETMVDRRGLLLNTHWSDAYGCWMCLLCCEDGPLRTIKSDSLGVTAEWIDDNTPIIIMNGDDDDDFDDTEDSDE